MTTSRVMPANVITHTYGGVDPDFTSLDAWVTYIKTNMTWATNAFVLVCREGVYDDRITNFQIPDYINQSYFSDTRFPVIMAEEGAEHHGIPGTGVIFKSTTVSSMNSYLTMFALQSQLYTSRANRLALYDLVFDGSNFLSGQIQTLVQADSFYYLYVTGCWFKDVLSSPWGGGLDVLSRGYNPHSYAIVRNCIATEIYSAGVFLAENTNDVATHIIAQNNTIVNSNVVVGSYGIGGFRGEIENTNNIINVTNALGNWGASNFVNTTYLDKPSPAPSYVGAGNFRLQSGDTVAQGNGTTIVAFNDDIKETERTEPWSIGFDQPTEPPAAPVVNPVSTPTKFTTQIVTGTKVANTSVWCNGVQVVAIDALTTWSASITLVEGANSLSFTVKDSEGGESDPTVASITVVFYGYRIGQLQIRDHYFSTVAEAEAAGRPYEICFVSETDLFYKYVALGSAYTVDHVTILDTVNGGDTRWVSVISNSSSSESSFYEEVSRTNGYITTITRYSDSTKTTLQQVSTITRVDNLTDNVVTQIYNTAGDAITSTITETISRTNGVITSVSKEVVYA